ncbi:MAG: DUF2480 family protein [Sporocytophaga sp.]|nr:DUF2480 family protein [Sporocytophaga sp.]
MGNEIVNRVANSDLVLINLEDYYHQGERVIYDIKDNLFQGLILREKEFRTFVKENDWSVYSGKNVAIICSEDAIVPSWAYMLLISKIEPYTNHVVFGDLGHLEQALFQAALSKIDPSVYKDAKVIIKGCSKFPVPLFAYGELTRILRPFVQSLMYGEPCSTVPIYKAPKK